MIIAKINNEEVAMHHLKLVKGLSYWSRFAKASKEHPDIYLEDGPDYEAALSCGFFAEVEDVPKDESAEGGDPVSVDTADGEDEPEESTADGFEEMSVADLKAYAQINGIGLGSAKKKDDILAAIRAAEAHAAEVRAEMRGE